MQYDTPLALNSTNDRVPAIAKAREAAAHIIAPKILFDLWPHTKSVRDTYLAIAACAEVGIEQPTIFELTLVSDLSIPSVRTGIDKLEAAGLIVRTQAEGTGIAGKRFDYMIPLFEEGGE